MPLSPSARLRYPAAWPAISAGIRKEASHE